MTATPDRSVTSLSGTYKVIAPSWVTDEDCRAVVETLESDGKTPYRSTTKGGFGVGIAIGGDGLSFELQGRTLSVLIFGITIGLIPVKEEDAASL